MFLPDRLHLSEIDTIVITPSQPLSFSLYPLPHHSTTYFLDQPIVRAAIHGRLLILDGIEKAERNVLSTINNLLENREMSLEDGRYLMNPERYDSMLSKGVKPGKEMIKVSERFLVIAIGLPVPR